MAIAGILLAAGSSRRFGEANKLLAEFDGVPLVVRAVQLLARCRIDHMVVVTGHDGSAVRDAIERATLAGLGPRSMSLSFVDNPRYLEGMGTSIAAGIDALADDVCGALIAQSDMPGMTPALVNALIARFEARDRQAVTFPRRRDGRQANPVLWPKRRFADLAQLFGDHGAKALIALEGERAEPVAWPDDRVFVDIDTTTELAANQHG